MTGATCAVCGAPAPGDWLCSSCRARAVDSYIPAPGADDGDASYARSIFRELSELEDRSFWFRSRNRLLVWALRRYFPDARRLLEVGCGTGYVLAALRRGLPDTEVAGAELYPEGLEVARERLPGVPLFQLDARGVPFSETFDVVGAFDVLEHIDDDEAALAGLRRAVRPGGGIVLTVPQHPRLWSPADDFGAHQRRYRRDELVDKVHAAGFRPVRVTSFVSLLLPLMAVERVAFARRRQEYDFRQEFDSSRLLDRLLEGVMTLERSAIRAGASLPVGGSLLLVARADAQ